VIPHAIEFESETTQDLRDRIAVALSVLPVLIDFIQDKVRVGNVAFIKLEVLFDVLATDACKLRGIESFELKCFFYFHTCVAISSI
jgi:hypothetical protein